jgi:hypothetical protein
MMDMRALKVGQKIYVHIGSHVYEATVTEMNGPDFGWRISLANWDGSRNGLPKGSFIEFDAAGNESGSYGWSADGWDSRPICDDLKIVEPCD